MLSWASICCPHSPFAIGATSGPSSQSRASASECAGSVDSASVRSPASAQRSAVAAAVVVLPTPPLPVKSRMRALTCGDSPGAPTGARSPLQVVPEIAQSGVDDAALGPSLHEPREGHHQVDLQVVDDLGAVGVA